MEFESVLQGLLGGVLIGIAAATLLVLEGRTAGVSGILGGLIPPRSSDAAWRLAFVIGLLAGGGVINLLAADPFDGLAGTPAIVLIPAGLLVGLGAHLGNGCTSGHGVCGVSRLAPRSIVATVTFMLTGGVTVFVVRHLMGLGW